MDYKELLSILKEFDQIDFKTIKETLKEFRGYKPIAHGYFFQINPNLALVLRKNRKYGILRRGRMYEIDILRKDSELTGSLLLYSSAYSSPKILDNLSPEIKEEVKKTLQEIKNKSILITKKYSLKPKRLIIKLLDV
ncbi:MAG: hypothetical protein QMD36_05845 [Candidatus Aenigmarchaeota archaeon]|nr:hypothetical protein [Candidatus Aenigmarchaeota archaeon]